jgi:predicted GIY-YIG superfamily endonuclease
MTNFRYVYILVDCATRTHFYVGQTSDLKTRLSAHNSGQCPHTSKYMPWNLQTAIAFEKEEKATAFEAYLKTHSGRAFATKHF